MDVIVKPANTGGNLKKFEKNLDKQATIFSTFQLLNKATFTPNYFLFLF